MRKNAERYLASEGEVHAVSSVARLKTERFRRFLDRQGASLLFLCSFWTFDRIP